MNKKNWVQKYSHTTQYTYIVIFVLGYFILAQPVYLLRGKLAAVCRKIATFCAQLFQPTTPLYYITKLLERALVYKYLHCLTVYNHSFI